MILQSPKDFGKWLNAELEAQGRTVKRTAQQLKMSRPHLSSIVNGRVIASLGTLIKIVGLLGYELVLRKKRRP